MIVGADDANDAAIIGKASRLYGTFGLRRVYYSAFSPIPRCQRRAAVEAPAAAARTPALSVGLADALLWLCPPQEVADAAGADGNLPLDIDPKLAWALKFRENFSCGCEPRRERTIAARAGTGDDGGGAGFSRRGGTGRSRLDDVARLTASIAKVRPFICALDWRPTLLTDRADLRGLIVPKSEQLELFLMPAMQNVSLVAHLCRAPARA